MKQNFGKRISYIVIIIFVSVFIVINFLNNNSEEIQAKENLNSFEQSLEKFDEKVYDLNVTLNTIDVDIENDLRKIRSSKVLLEYAIKDRKDLNFYLKITRDYFEEEQYDHVTRVFLVQQDRIDSLVQKLERIENIINEISIFNKTGNQFP